MRDVRFAINHMTAPRLRWDEFITLARDLGCVGVEFRNDLGRPLFDGEAPEMVADRVRQLGLRIVGLSQVYPFNDWSEAVRAEVAALIQSAVACGAETISLIPRNDGKGIGEGERQANLRLALREIKSMLEKADIVALVEPLGFESSSLRSKAETVAAIESLDAAHCFRLVHDTFHHHLAGRGPYFPERTGIVHVSGIVDSSLAVSEMRDEHRILVDVDDRLGNVEQIGRLLDAGYAGPISFEAFSPEVHALSDPTDALSESMRFIKARIGRITA